MKTEMIFVYYIPIKTISSRKHDVLTAYIHFVSLPYRYHIQTQQLGDNNRPSILNTTSVCECLSATF